MKKTFSLSFCFCIIYISIIASPSDSLHVAEVDSIALSSRKISSHSALIPGKTQRVFPSIDNKIIARRLDQPFFMSRYVQSPTPNELDIRASIEATYEKVISEDRFIDFLDENSLIEFPIGMKKDLGALTYTILIDSVVMTPTESFLYASMVFEIPENKRKIHFKGADIKFSKSGGLSGDGKLMLVGDYALNLDGDNSQLVIKGEADKTFVEFDCNGYKQLSIDGAIVFSRDILEPVDEKGTVLPDKNVAVNFTTTVSDWSDILVEVNIPKFQMPGLKDVSFSVTQAVLDFSDTRNPLAINFPSDYMEKSTLFVPGNISLWRGIYIKQLEIDLPNAFNQEGENKRTKFIGSDLILDNIGFSGKLNATNLIPLEKGKMGNWNFSLDNLMINISANELTDAGFNGTIQIPLAKNDKEQLFNYEAIINPGSDYLFKVKNTEALQFDLWKADVQIHPSSYIEVLIADGKFMPKAQLNGEMTMNLGLEESGQANANDSKNVKLAKVKFERLEIQSVKPYVKIGTFSLGTEGMSSGMGGFPIRVNDISGKEVGNTVTLAVDVTLSLSGDSNGSFGADGKFSIVAESVESGNDLSYRFKKLNIERFGVNIDKGAFKFKGTLNFYKEDIVYGNGISGTIDATFEPSFSLKASAIFGSKDGMRYWYTDALATFEAGVTIFPGFAFYGFGGGAYYHMKIDDQMVGSPLGKTASGIVYVPDPSVGYGFKASLSIGVQPGKQAFNGDVTYEMAFNQSGGVRYINLSGNGYFLTQPIPPSAAEIQNKSKKIAEESKKSPDGLLNEGSKSTTASQNIHGSPSVAGERAQIWATTNINYDIDNRILHGNLKAYLNVAKGVIKGAGPGNLAGEAVLHFAPGEWYIYIGRPEYENRFAIEVLGIARLDSYFVIGSVIPDSPPPPSNVSSILGGMDLSYMDDLNELADGAGVGFGSSFHVDTGDQTFLMFYGRFAAGLGFDIMLKDYGDAYCKGGGRLGINGWYANGQAYAFFEGSIGIQVKVWKKTKRIQILDIGAAVIAQAKLPNPTWVRGVAGGHFRVLGGLVKGQCKFEIEIGQECEIIKKEQSVLESVEAVAQITPGPNETHVDVFTTPQAIFNYEMEKEYEMVDDDNNVVKFKISLDEIKLVKKGSTTAIVSSVNWNHDKTVAALNPFEILPSESELVFNIEVSFKEFKNGKWIIPQVDGEALKKTYAVSFTTGVAPDYIPESNIAYSYPINGQYNFYKDEYADGYIMLKQGQSYLFENTGWSHFIRFTSLQASDVVETPFKYSADSKELTAKLPNSLRNDQLYQLSILAVPQQVSRSVDANVDTARTKISGTVDLELKTRKAEGTLQDFQEKELYTAFFRTSKYNTFADKMAASGLSKGWRDVMVAGVHVIGSNFRGPEPFSLAEIKGSAIHDPLIQIEADLNNVPWFHDEIKPLIYEDYPINNLFRIRNFNRNPNLLGEIPVKAVFLYQLPYRIELTESMISSGNITMQSTSGRIDYSLAYYMYYDFIDLASQVANYVGNGGVLTPRMSRLLNGKFPVVQMGDYWVNVNYVLPGRNSISSTYRHKIYNPIDR